MKKIVFANTATQYLEHLCLSKTRYTTTDITKFKESFKNTILQKFKDSSVVTINLCKKDPILSDVSRATNMLFWQEHPNATIVIALSTDYVIIKHDLAQEITSINTEYRN